MYEIIKENYGLIVIIKFKGSMGIEDAVKIQKDIEQIIIRSKAKDFVLDLVDVNKIDSTGLGTLVGAQATGRVNAKRLMFYRPNKLFMDMLEDSELSGFFPMLEDDDDLMGRFAKI